MNSAAEQTRSTSVVVVVLLIAAGLLLAFAVAVWSTRRYRQVRKRRQFDRALYPLSPQAAQD